MRPTFLGFEAARSGLVASQKALDITGNNVANMDTEGYTRQRVDLVSVSISGSNNRYANSLMAGAGVYIVGVSQVRDPYLDARYREQSSYLGDLATQLTAYTDMENLFDDVTSSGLQDAMTKFMGQLQDLSNNSEKPENANSVLTAAKNMVQLINSYNSKLDQIAKQNQTGLEIGVQNVNSILEKLASLNTQIKDACLANTTIDPTTGERRMLGPYGPNELFDDRNLLLDQLSAYGEVDVKSESDGTITLNFAGTEVLKGSKYDTLNLSQDASGSNVLEWSRSKETFKAEAGAIKAYVNVLNGKGGYAVGGENSYEGIGYYREVLNSFADTVATEFNKANTFTDSDGAVHGGDLFSKSNPADLIFTAKNLRISDAWMENSQYILMSNTTTEGELDTSNLQKMIKMFDESFTFKSTTTKPDGTPTYTEFSGTFEGYLTHFQNKLGNQTGYIKGTYESTTSVATDLLDMRDSISAVSENEEAVNMMKYQKSYNAAARVITAMDEVLDVLINKMGRVGL